MSAAHLHPRAEKAAREVDPVMLAQALDHIARTAKLSHTQTRRLRWIEQRATLALNGREYRDCDADLPKNASEESVERLRRDRARLREQHAELLEAADVLLDNLVAYIRRDHPNENPEDDARVKLARAAIAKATGSAS